MNNYIDSYGRYHDKPVTEDKPIPSNNGWIYTAYTQKTGIPLDYSKLQFCFDGCKIRIGNRFELIRSPGKSTPPVSRDEVLGMSALSLLKPEHLKGWNFSPYPIPRFSLKKLVKQLWELSPRFVINKPQILDNGRYDTYTGLELKHRNYFWQNGLDQIYRFAFSVPLSDRAFILKKWGMFNVLNPVHLFYAAFGKLSSFYKPNGLDWLKYGVGKEEMVKEFPVDHPIRTKLGL